jgi:hypothetical protein
VSLTAENVRERLSFRSSRAHHSGLRLIRRVVSLASMITCSLLKGTINESTVLERFDQLGSSREDRAIVGGERGVTILQLAFHCSFRHLAGSLLAR